MEIVEEEHSFLTKVNGPNYVYKYKWIIKNFTSPYFEKETGEFIVSPTFHTSNNECYMKLYPKEYDSRYSEHLSVSLGTRTKEDPNVAPRVNFSILDNKLKTVHTDTGSFILHQCKSTDIGSLKFVNHDTLLDVSKKLLVDNQLTIVCTIVRFMTDERVRTFNSTKPERYSDEFTLSNEFEAILNNKLFADTVLVANDKELHAHKVILAARSPVFAAMFQNEMKEKINSRIEINDVDVDVVSKMIQNMYTDIVTRIDDHFAELLYVANKYDIKRLKLLCEQNIISDLNITNFDRVYALAETYRCDLLKQTVLKFLIHNAGRIIETLQFNLWKKELPPIVVDIIMANV